MSYLVGLDAGHGMHTPGKRTPKFKQDVVVDGKTLVKKGQFIHENEWNRAVADYCGKALKRCGIKTYFTADMDGSEDTPLSTRSNRANQKGCDILVSFHYNAFGSCSSFVDRKGGLLVLRTEVCSKNSIRLGNLIADQLEKDIKTYKYSYGLRRDVDISGFTLAILRQTEMPAVLVEYGFMDVLHEAKLMKNKSHQKKCGESTAKAICKYLGVTYKAEKPKDEKPQEEKPNKFKPYYVKIICDSLNGREGPGTDYKVVQVIKKGEAVTIVQEKKISNGDTWGKTKTGYWINVSEKYVKFLRYV